MDKHVPPDITPNSGRPFASRTWRKKYECKSNKGDHTYRLSKRASWWSHGKWTTTDHMTVEEYYRKELEAIDKRNVDTFKQRALTGRNYHLSTLRFHYECSACKKQNGDSNRHPDKKVRSKLPPEELAFAESLWEEGIDKDLRGWYF